MLKKTPKQARLEYAEREIQLAKQILENEPDNQVQKDRLAYWSFELGDMDTAIQYGTSPKLQGMIAEWQRQQALMTS